MDPIDKLTSKRKELVIAAEQTVERMFESGRPEIKKTQLNHLIAVCGEAACAEEIMNYIRYQAGRKGTGWGAVADGVIQGIDQILSTIEEDRLRVEAFRLYAIFLTRAFTYRSAAGATMPQPRPPHHEPTGAGQGRRR